MSQGTTNTNGRGDDDALRQSAATRRSQRDQYHHEVYVHHSNHHSNVDGGIRGSMLDADGGGVTTVRSSYGGVRRSVRASALSPPTLVASPYAPILSSIEAGASNALHRQSMARGGGSGDGGGKENDDNATKQEAPAGQRSYNPFAFISAFFLEMYSDVCVFMRELIDGYGSKFVAMLAVVYFCMKGLSNNATSAAMLPFYKTSLKIPSTEYQKYFNVANMAFSLKPLIGLLSDLLPIRGYSKRYYVAIISLCSAGSLATIAVWAAGEGSGAAGPITAALFFVFFTGIAGTDLLMEGKYSEMMNVKKAPPSVITFVWLCFSLGALGGALLEGPMADLTRAEVILMVAAPFAAIPAIFALLGWIPEKRRKGGFLCGGDNADALPTAEDTDYVTMFNADNKNNSAAVGRTGSLSRVPLSSNEEGNNYGGTGGDDEASRREQQQSEALLSSSPPQQQRQTAEDDAIDPNGEEGELIGNESNTSSFVYEITDEDFDETPQGWAQDTDGPILRALRSPTGLAVLGAVTALTSLTMAIISLLVKANEPLLYFIAPAATLLLIASFVILPRAAALANLFMFCRELFYLQITGPLDYFYTATPECLPDGPHFSYSYYQTLVSFLGAGGTMAGTIIFQRFLSKMTFMKVFWVSTTLKILASGFDLIITKRWNVHYLGISDELMFLCGDAIIYPICTMLDFMPTTVLLSRLCPRGMESTMFALLASFNNFGASISRAVGYIIAERVGIRTDGDNCDFTNLWLLVVLGHMLLPTTIYFNSWALMPDTPMTATIPKDTEGEKGGEGDEAEIEIKTRNNFIRPAAEDKEEEDCDRRSFVGSSNANRKQPLKKMFSTSTNGGDFSDKGDDKEVVVHEDVSDGDDGDEENPRNSMYSPMESDDAGIAYRFSTANMLKPPQKGGEGAEASGVGENETAHDGTNAAAQPTSDMISPYTARQRELTDD